MLFQPIPDSFAQQSDQYNGHRQAWKEKRARHVRLLMWVLSHIVRALDRRVFATCEKASTVYFFIKRT